MMIFQFDYFISQVKSAGCFCARDFRTFISRNRRTFLHFLAISILTIIPFTSQYSESNDSGEINKEIGISPDISQYKQNSYLVFQFEITDQVYDKPEWKSYRAPREKQMTELFETQLIKNKKRIVDREKIDSLVKEMGFSNTGLTINQGTKIGKLLNADAMVFGSISRITFFDDTKTILIVVSVKAIHVETGVLLWKGTLDGTISYATSKTQGEQEVQLLSAKIFKELFKEIGK